MSNFVASELTYRWITVNFSPGKLSGDVVSWRICANERKYRNWETTKRNISLLGTWCMVVSNTKCCLWKQRILRICVTFWNVWQSYACLSLKSVCMVVSVLYEITPRVSTVEHMILIKVLEFIVFRQRKIYTDDIPIDIKR